VPKRLEVDQDNLRMKFLALNVDFNRLGSRRYRNNYSLLLTSFSVATYVDDLE